MIFAIYSLLAGVLSGILSIVFRLYEIGHEKILVGRQFFIQILLFIVTCYIFAQFFSEYFLQIFGIKVTWFFVFFFLSSLSYYMVQVLFEWKSRISLFPTEDEIEAYIEKHMQ